MKILGFSLTSYESGYALMKNKEVEGVGELNINVNRGYIGRLKDIFYQSRRLIYDNKPDFIAVKQEVLQGHPERL